MIDRRFRLLVAIVMPVMFAYVPALFAQVADPVIAAEAPVPGSGHSYIGLGSETVNPADGSLTFDLPLKTPPGRQISMNFGIRFSGSEQFHLTNQDSPGGQQHLGWSRTGSTAKIPGKLAGGAMICQSSPASRRFFG
jgi:hypothetical protein